MSERDEIAKAFHNIYLVTAKAFKWSIHPEVDVEFKELSKDAQELDYALADFHLSEIARLRAEVERLQHINAELLKQKDGVDKDVFGTVCFERDEALAEVGRLRQCRTCCGIPHVSGKMCICGGTNFVEEEIRQLRLALFLAERERDEALAQVAVLVQAVEGARHPVGMANEGDIQFWYERLTCVLAEAPTEARALLDRLRRAEAVLRGGLRLRTILDEKSLHKGWIVAKPGLDARHIQEAVSEWFKALAAWEETA